jgi:CRISPR-associated endonuclease/helicase Cas3
MNGNCPIWAKSGERSGGKPVRLFEHIKDVLGAFEGLRDKVKDQCLRDLIRLAIICHDFGKVLPAFQIRKLGNRQYEPFDVCHYIDHSLVSVLWVAQDKLEERIKSAGPDAAQDEIEDYKRFVLSAVAYHHWRERFFDLLSPGCRDFQDLCKKLLDDEKFLAALKENLIAEVKQIAYSGSLVEFNREMAQGLKNGVPFTQYATPPYQLYWLPKRIITSEEKLKKWILISGFLQRADHYASFCEEDGEELSSVELPAPSFDEMKMKVKQKIQEKAPTVEEKSIWQLQKIGSLRDKNVILIAPTGYGKTEFAFLWSHGEKFFYTLPLRAAVNQIYERAKCIFGDDRTGLLHSDADVYLLGDGGEAQASMKVYDLARQLAFPAIISTGDQFFPYALRPPGYERIYATFSYSRLVIDEVQAYDPRAAAIIVKFIEDVVRMGGKFLLMTATLPKFVQDEINRAIGNHNYEKLNLCEEEQSKFKEIRKHCIKVEIIENAQEDGKTNFTIGEDKLKEVLEKAREGKRVLVIVNTVKQAQDVFDWLKKLIEKHAEYESLKDKLWLLHSRFTLKDRELKENDLKDKFKNPKPKDENDGKILVSTQVVEASLDIDADVLFTEVAPLDALVQRMGRVWRRYGPMTEPDKIPEIANPNVYVWVFQHGLQSGRQHVYNADLLLFTLKLLKELKLLKDQGKEQSAEKLNENFKDWLRQKMSIKNLEERISSVLEELFDTHQNAQKKTRRSKKGRSKNATSPASVSAPRAFELTLSEYDKFILVENLYDLPDDCEYMLEFQKAKDILDAGYMSDRLEDARKIFREIFDISVVCKEQKEKFLEAITNFFRDHREDGKGLYPRFKKEVLARFVVSVPWWRSQVERRRLQVGEDANAKSDLKESELKRVQRWCRDIYLTGYEYDDHIGLIM